VIKLGVRRGDGAPISVVELLVERPVVVEETGKDKGSKGKLAKTGKPAKSAKAGASRKKKSAKK
jgi:hypothetical protein